MRIEEQNLNVSKEEVLACLEPEERNQLEKQERYYRRMAQIMTPLGLALGWARTALAIGILLYVSWRFMPRVVFWLLLAFVVVSYIYDYAGAFYLARLSDGLREQKYKAAKKLIVSKLGNVIGRQMDEAKPEDKSGGNDPSSLPPVRGGTPTGEA